MPADVTMDTLAMNQPKRRPLAADRQRVSGVGLDTPLGEAVAYNI